MINKTLKLRYVKSMRCVSPVIGAFAYFLLNVLWNSRCYREMMTISLTDCNIQSSEPWLTTNTIINNSVCAQFNVYNYMHIHIYILYDMLHICK